MVIRTLAASDFETVFSTFAEAFSDYVVPFAPTREQLREMLTRRGWVPELSVAAFEDERMVAFTLNGLDGERGYDSGTGVVPSHRRRGLGRELMEQSCDLLRAAGAREYVLEVIDTNTRAVELYRSTGFVETRGLQCWRYESPSTDISAANSSTRESSSFQPADIVSEWRDVEPSWQNSDASIARARDPHILFGDAQGYAILFPSSGDLAQFAVRPDARRQGVGTRLLQSADALAGKPLRIMNVDERDAGIAAFLERSGAKKIVRQLELIRSL